MIMSKWGFLNPTQSIVGRIFAVSLLTGGLLIACTFAVNVFVSPPTEASSCCAGSKINHSSGNIPKTPNACCKDSATSSCCEIHNTNADDNNLNSPDTSNGIVPLTSVTCSRTSGASKKCSLSNGSKCSHNCKKKKRCSYSGC